MKTMRNKTPTPRNRTTMATVFAAMLLWFMAYLWVHSVMETVIYGDGTILVGTLMLILALVAGIWVFDWILGGRGKTGDAG